jgi:flagellin-like hook-associated protein FlgL
MVINTNITAQKTAFNFNVSQTQLSQSLSRLSSGSKIIKPSDDAGGLAVTSRTQSIIKRLDAALNDVANANSYSQTQDGYLKNVDKAFRRMGELAVLAKDETKTVEDRSLYNMEFKKLQEYVANVAIQEFNGISLFDGKKLEVVQDENGNMFSMDGVKLIGEPYSNAINSGTNSWTLNQPAWETSTDIFQLNEDAWLTSKPGYVTNQPLWKLPPGQLDTIEITAGNHSGDTFTVTANGQTTGPIASVPSVPKVSQVVINATNGAAPGATYSIQYTTPAGGPTITVTEGVDFHRSGGNDTQLIRDALVAKVNADPNSPATAAVGPDWTSWGSNNALRLTAKVPGEDFYAHLSCSDPNGGSVGCHPLTYNYNGDAATATQIRNAVNALPGVSASVSGNVISITSDPSGSTLSGPTSISLGNTDGSNASTPTILSPTHSTSNPGNGATFVPSGSFMSDPVVVQGVPNAATQVESGTFVTVDPGSADAQATSYTSGSTVSGNLGSNAIALGAGSVTAITQAGEFTTTDPTSFDPNAEFVAAGSLVTTSQDLGATGLNIATENSADYQDVNLNSTAGATIAHSLIQTAINQLAADRSVLGAGMSRLEFTKDQLVVLKDNMSHAVSRIKDVNFAEESTNYARSQILVQTGANLLTEANLVPKVMLQLLE